MEDSERPADPKAPGAFEQRLASILEYQTLFVFRNVCRGLFEAHKLLFAFLICAQILRNRGDVTAMEWNLLLRGPGVPDRAELPPNPDGDHITEHNWDLIHAASTRVEGLAGLSADISSSWDELGGWSEWAHSPAPSDSALPGRWAGQVSAFQKLLLVKAFRDEKLVFAIRNYVKEQLGALFVTASSTSMEEIHDDMDCATPCIFVLSQGADPTSILLRFAERQVVCHARANSHPPRPTRAPRPQRL